MIRWRNRGNKYGAVKTLVDGITFDSKAEARRYQELKLLRNTQHISDFAIHPRYAIEINGIKICDVVLDFHYYSYDRHQRVYEDVKGRDNPLSRLKRKMLEAHQHIKVDVIAANTRLKKH